MTDWLLQNGTVIDGSGAPRFSADVLLRDGKIADVGQIAETVEARRLDCTGHVIAPAFLDAHSHSDLQVIEGRRDKLRQGVTTEVVGNCGFSAYPPAPDPAELREFAGGIFCGDDQWGWPDTKSYLDAIERSATANVISLVGHGTLRIAVAGNRQGPLPEEDVQRMEHLLDDCLAAGAAGFSTGLMYAPGSSAPKEELERLCKVVARHGKVYATHMRTYFGGVVSAIEEQLHLARVSSCRLQISHLQTVGAPNWPMHQRAIETIERAVADGIDIAFDCYPYVAGSTVLTQVLPQWTLDGGLAAMCARLHDPATRQRIADELKAALQWRWQDIYISAVATKENESLVGMNLQQIAERRGITPMETLFTVLLEEKGVVNMIAFNQSEDNLRLSLTHPLAIVISDGFYVKGRAHPRLYGTFPFFLGTISRERKWLTLEEAIRKITLAPAERFHHPELGLLASGKQADVVVFDPLEIDSAASYDNPAVAPVGIRQVFRKGELIEGAV